MVGFFNGRKFSLGLRNNFYFLNMHLLSLRSLVINNKRSVHIPVNDPNADHSS